MTATNEVQMLPEEREMLVATIKELTGHGAESSKRTGRASVTYIGGPGYRIVVMAENFKVAEKTMNNTMEKIRSAIEKQHAPFDFSREESKKAHQQGQVV